MVRYDPGHPSPVKPVGGLDGLGALQLGTLSEAAEVINYRAAMVGLNPRAGVVRVQCLQRRCMPRQAIAVAAVIRES